MKKTVGDNLKLFRLRSNLSMDAAGKLLNMSAPAILKFERNEIIASLDRLEAFASTYNTTVEEILEVEDSHEIKFTNFKCDSKTSKTKEEKIKNIIETKIDNYFALLKLSNLTLQNKFGVHIINDVKEAESLATKLRIYFTIPIDAPISNLVYLLESHGMMIITIPKDNITKDFIGFYEIIDNVPVIAVPLASNGYEQRYDIAKSLGELLIMTNTNKKDLFTTVFALSLLIPKESLINEFDAKRIKVSFREIEIFSSVYRVSYKNIVRRLLDTNIITQSNAKYTNIFINKNNKKENIYLEEPYNYDKMLYKLFAEGVIKDIRKYQ
jgi:transcriptional regulator with XRE-family HTH domain